MLNLRRLSWAILVVAGFGMSAATSRAVDYRLLPPDTEIVFTLNVKQILNSEIVKGQQAGLDSVKTAFANSVPGGEETLKYLKRMDFDPFRDTVSITAAHNGSQDPKDLFFIIDVVVDADKFADTAKAAAGNNGELRIIKVGNVSVYEISMPGNQKGYAALLNRKSLVVCASEEGIKGAIDRSQGTQITAAKVREFLKTANDKQSFNFALTGTALGKLGEQAQKKGGAAQIPIGNALNEVAGISGAVTLTKEIEFQLGVGAKSEKAAKEMVEQGTVGLFLLGTFVATQAKNNPDFAPLQDVVSTLRISRVGSNALLRGSISNDNLEKLMKAAQNLRGGF